ncbi:ABC-F family ATP-binding cassette domain-containing protein [Alistipes finegoldii]|uniref:ABC-F family ATP-binding cassette domain-containing protein n=1 Tax=Alistipes finegoldii TaxID=214856 RepID=UPI00256F1D03|nr:ABC-F family ATP-binding cassette domain-containing protein [Alistipes finegoldii]
MACCLQVENLTKSFGDLVLFENISFAIEDGRRVALVAKNGTGKTTLLNIIAGREDHDGGEVVPRRDLRIAYLEQSPEYPAEMTVLEACFHSENPALKAIAEYERAIEEPSGEGLQEAMARMDALEAWDYEQRAKRILSRLKIRDFGQRVGTLSGGQLKRVALANALISESDLLILDEPTNHLDTDMTEWLEEYLAASGAGLLMVTHDRYFLDKVCSDILEIEDRQLYHYAGNYSYYLEKKQERETAQAARRESETNLYRRELEWMRRQPQARATKARSRIDAFHELEARLQSTRSRGEVRLDVKASRIGTKIFEAKEVGKRFGELVILDKFNYNFTRYEKLGIVGDNGCGKSTFLKLLTGIERPDSGTIEVGETVRFGYYSQQGLEFDEGKRVIDVVTEIAEQIDLGDGRRMSASQFLQHFLFTPETQHSFVARLSGGERRRLYLCTVLMRNPNFLILDEPTNDLDIVTLGILEEYLRAFKGCVIVVSHDRYFVDKVADHLLVFCGGGEIKDFTGTYSEYVAWKREYEAARHAQEVQARPKPQAVRTQAAETAPRKLSYNEKRELEMLEREIPVLEAEKAALEESLSSGSLGVDELTAQSQRIAELIGLIDEKTMRWLLLSER